MWNYKQTQEAALDKIILKFFSTYSFILFRSLCIDRFLIYLGRMPEITCFCYPKVAIPGNVRYG